MTLADPRPILADAVVSALPAETQRVLLALLRESDHWGEIAARAAVAIARRVSAHNATAARTHLARLHEARLLQRCDVTGVLIVWTPAQRADADVFQ